LPTIVPAAEAASGPGKPKEKKGKKQTTLTGQIAPEKKKKKKDAPSVQKPETKILVNTEDPAFTPADEDGDKRSGGRKLDPLLLKISKPCLDADGKKLVRCLASTGCRTTWVWPRAKDRILNPVGNLLYFTLIYTGKSGQIGRCHDPL
jgi:hypothetical protein